MAAFEPFGGWKTNSSQEALRAFACGGLRRELRTIVLPVVYRAAAVTLADAIEREQPAVVVVFGQAEGSEAIRVERRAVNLVSAPAPDEAGGLPFGEPVVAGGPMEYPSALPVTAVLRELRAAGIPAEPSTDAGGYVCNHVFYALMHLLAEERADFIGGLVHLPGLPEQAVERGGPSMDVETLARAVEIAVSVSTQHAEALAASE